MKEILYPICGTLMIAGIIWFVLGLISPKKFKMGRWSRKSIALAFVLFFFVTGGALAAVEPDGVKQARIEKEKQAKILAEEDAAKEARLNHEAESRKKQEAARKKEEKKKAEAKKIAKEKEKEEEKAKKDVASAATPAPQPPPPTPQPTPSPPPAPVAPTSTAGVVKKSVNDICHAPGTTYYDRTKNYTPYNSLQDCLNSGGRLPLR